MGIIFDTGRNLETYRPLNGTEGAGATEGAGNVGGTGAGTRTEGLRVTDAKGGMQTPPPADMPEMEPPGGVGEAGDVVAEDIEKKTDGTFDALGTTASSTASQAALFDLYQLMQLMLQVAQKQRETARYTREADLTRQVADIKCQAQQQRSAARTGLIMSAVFAAASIAAQGISAAASSKAQASAADMTKAAGVDQAQQNLSLASAKDAVEARTNLTGIEKGMTEDQITSAKANFADSARTKTELDAAIADRKAYIAENGPHKAAVEEVDSQIAAKQTEVDVLQSDLCELREDAAATGAQFDEFAGADGAESGLAAEIDAKQAELSRAEAELADLQARREAKIADLEVSDPKLKAMGERIDTAKQNYAKALDTDRAQTDAGLAAKRLKLEQLESAPNATSKEIKAQKAVVADAEKASAWGRAHVVVEKMESGMPEALATDVESAQSAFDQKALLLKHNAEYKAAEAKAQGWQTAGDLFRQFGTTMDGVVRSITGMMDASATEYGAAAKSSEAAMGQSEDLAQSAQQLTRSVLDLLQAVLSAENQSISRILA